MIRGMLANQLTRNAISGPLAATLNLAVTAIAYPLYLGRLGYEAYGVWLVLAAVLNAAQLGNLGISTAMMKLVSHEHERGDVRAIRQYTSSATAVLLASGLVALAAVYGFRRQLVDVIGLTDEHARTLLALLPLVGCLSAYVLVVQAVSATVSGLGRMDIANYLRVAGRILSVATAACLLYAGRGIESLLIGDVLMYGFIHLISIIVFRRMTGLPFFRISNVNRGHCASLLHLGSGVVGGAAMAMLLSPFNKLMLTRYAGVAVVPVYEIAYGASMQARTLLESAFRALVPEVGRLSAVRREDTAAKLIHVHRRAMGLICSVGLPVFGGAFVLAEPILRHWLRSRFAATIPGPLRIMLISMFISLLGVPSYYTLLGLGRVRQTFVSHVILCVLSAVIVIVALLAMKGLTVTVVAMALLVGTTVSTGYLLWQRTRTLSSLNR